MKKWKWMMAAILFSGHTVVTSCSSDDDTASPEPQHTGIKLANLDTSVRPGDDFYQFACGGWMKANPLPAAYSRYGSFEQLRDANNKRLKTLLDEVLHGNYAAGTDEQKLSDLYKLAMDETRRNQQGVEPLMPYLRQIEQATTPEALLQVQLALAPLDYSGCMGVRLDADEKNSTQNILKLEQGGLVLSQKEYYVDSDAATIAIREAYRQHIVTMLQRFGFTAEAATAKMQHIVSIETALAQASRSRSELRDPQANYHKMTLQQFEAAYPHLQLEKLMNARGIPSAAMQELVVGQPDFFARAEQVAATATLAEQRDYMEWLLVNMYAPYLDEATQATRFDFFGRVLSGRKEDYPLWRRATEQMEALMGEALGKLYVAKYFPAAAKERMVQLVGNLQKALAERIDAQQWMSAATKARAHEKLSSFIVKVGYPDKWTDMSRLDIDPQKSYLENVMACRRFIVANDIEQRAGKPVDRSVWLMTPQTVNAYYNPPTNEICFPAGILQPPFFDLEADDAFNYGAIGVVIGHEMTHGFDDQGRHYDKDGNMRDWWEPADAQQFKERADLYVRFFSNIEVLPGLHANGQMTLGENLADHGGLQVAWTAFKNVTRSNPLPDSDGYTADQRFFLAYGGLWAENITDEGIRYRTMNDVHSLGRLRTNAALQHIDAWYETFGVKEGDKMFVPKKERLELW